MQPVVGIAYPDTASKSQQAKLCIQTGGSGSFTDLNWEASYETMMAGYLGLPFSGLGKPSPTKGCKDFSTRPTILRASAAASAIAAMYAGLFGGTVDNFRAAKIAATIAIMPCLRLGSTTGRYHLRFYFAMRMYNSSCLCKSSTITHQSVGSHRFVLPDLAVGVCGAGF
jgi:hypothetical protein